MKSLKSPFANDELLESIEMAFIPTTWTWSVTEKEIPGALLIAICNKVGA